MKEYERLTKQGLDWQSDVQCDDEKIYNRLAELENKLENGTLIELPCKVGDRIWCIINNKHIFGRRIKEIIFKKKLGGGYKQLTKLVGWIWNAFVCKNLVKPYS